MPFEYSLRDADVPDKDVINAIWVEGQILRESGASNEVIENALDNIIKREYQDKVPERMKELKLLFFSDYKPPTFDAGSNLFKITPQSGCKL